jgi:hypothetical protein
MIARLGWARILLCLAVVALATHYLLRPRPVPVVEVALDADRRQEATIERIGAKLLLIEEVAAGRMGLLEAAARFQALNLAAEGKDWDHYRQLYPGASDDERHCREVLRWAERLEFSDPCLWLAVSTRLEGELRAALAAGPIRLPAPPSALVGRPG